MDASNKSPFWPLSRLSVLFLLTFTFILLGPSPVVSALGKRWGMSPRSTLLMPLYIYPSPGAWQPLYDAIESHPYLDFVVVINPASGPGAYALPDANYTREIPALKNYTNVEVIGYVPITHGSKPWSDISKEIDTYSYWGLENPALKLRGIFVDETPGLYDDQNAQILKNISSAVRNSTGLAGDLVVINPGCCADPKFMESADAAVLFEGTYQTYLERTVTKVFSDMTDITRRDLAVLVYDVPRDLPLEDYRAFVAELRDVAGYIFITDLTEDFYNFFSYRFGEFARAMAGL